MRTAEPDARADGLALPARGQVVQGLVGFALAAVLLGWGLPLVTGSTWGQIGALVAGVGPGTFLVLLALMFVGLGCYTFTLTGSLPGLTHRRALTVNLAGSAVSNVVPGGGAVGTALTWAMYRSWGFTHRDISTSVVVTTVWNLLARVLLPVVAALVLLAEGGALPRGIAGGAAAGGAGGALVAALLVAVVVSRPAARLLGRVADRVAAPLLARRRGSRDGPRLEEAVLDVRRHIFGVVARRWPGLTLGLVGFMGTYFVLFALCAQAVGVTMSAPQLFAAYAVGRLLTAVAVTPGGIGMAEAGSAAVLLALGAPGDAAAAAVTLFALFSFLLEIPFGAVALVLWLAARR